jgi:hypothetical protein
MIAFPYRGVETWTNHFGFRVVRLHYSADPDKTPGWAEKQRKGMTDPAMFEQEFEINFNATRGQLIYQWQDEATLCKSFPIPHNWTRYTALDPHPRVPHAMLWGAVDPHGDLWIYREYWPSRVYGIPGRIPEEDTRVNIKDYVQVIKWLESAENPENQGKDEKIYRRVIDYAARSFGQGTTDDPEQPNFQQRFESKAREVIDEERKQIAEGKISRVTNPEFYMRFEDAKKDHGVGFETVNEWLKPRPCYEDDNLVFRSHVHIFQDACPELLLEMRDYRHKPLTPLQTESQDPSPLPINKRIHMCDNFRYLVMEGPEHAIMKPMRSTWKPMRDGVAY